MLKNSYDFLLNIATVIGLGGAADKLDLNKALVQAQGKIDNICNYHNISQNQNRQIFQSIEPEIKNKCIIGEIELIDFYEKLEQMEDLIIFGSKWPKNKLPKNLNLSHVYYLKSCFQPNIWSCGYFSVYNSYALEEILLSPGRYNNILSYAQLKHFAAQRWQEDLDDEDSILNNNLNRLIRIHKIYHLAHENRLNNNFFVLTLINGQNVSYQPFINLDAQEDSEINDQVHNATNLNHQQFWLNLKNRLDNSMRNNMPLNLYFACKAYCGNSDHWILITISCKVNRKPIMIILDSSNLETVNSSYCQFINFLYQKFIVPYIANQA